MIGPRFAQPQMMFGRSDGGWVLVLIFAFAVSVPDASAQIDNRLAIGGSVIARVASSSSARGGADLAFELRLGHERQGWVPQLSFFNWFDTDVGTSSNGRISELGELRVRPLLAGYGYTWARGRTTITADVVGGFAINSFDLNTAATADYESRFGAGTLRTSASNTWAVKPEVQVWRDVNDRFGWKINAGYLIARPSVTIMGASGQDTRSVHADTLLITIGLVYSIF